MLDGKTILVTGGTGSFGKKFTRRLLSRHHPQKVIIYSRDEYKQYTMRRSLSEYADKLRFFLGDVRDKDRLCRAFDNVDYVVHAAALKQVPALEYNPTEAVNTNVIGADNIVDAAIDRNVKIVIALSTDKAVNPVNLYGATKLVAEKIFIAANAYSGGKVIFAVVRYGNVMGSRGSVIPLFMDLKKQGISQFPITDERMTRFWITLDQSADLIIKALEEAEGGEIFVPKLPSMKIVDLARAIDPECEPVYTGIRPGEKVHEGLLSHDETRNTKEFDGMYVVVPQFYESNKTHEKYSNCPSLPEGFVFTSDANTQWLTEDELRDKIQDLEVE